ncbi:MAG: GTPase HflX [Brevinematia bacterium]
MKCLIIVAEKNIKKTDKEYLNDKIQEIKSLVTTLGWKILDTLIVNLRSIDPGFYLTEGKVREIKLLPQTCDAECLVFYNNLSPIHIRNLEREFGKKILTRVDIILMIFKEHAVSMEAKLQVELATLQIQLPRIYGIGKEMEQIRGGIGLRGPGERKTETMKRHIKEKIRTLKSKIEEIKKNRLTQFKGREKVFNVSIVGYTNSGKSTLMNVLTKANVPEEDKLFSTLDTKTKKMFIEGITMTLTDTVGFIEDLPHQLIESFYSTLEVVKRSSLLLHVVDISSKFADEKIRVVNEVIREIFAQDSLKLPEMVYVFNKVDLVSDIRVIEKFSNAYPNSVIISAKERINIEELKSKLKHLAEEFYRNL